MLLTLSRRARGEDRGVCGADDRDSGLLPRLLRREGAEGNACICDNGATGPAPLLLRRECDADADRPESTLSAREARGDASRLNERPRPKAGLLDGAGFPCGIVGGCWTAMPLCAAGC
ncbi:hypothetical protein [Paraburkholderia humisilvae]|nr:hypothetical protein [Paraburkholderia humisilvae]